MPSDAATAALLDIEQPIGLAIQFVTLSDYEAFQSGHPSGLRRNALPRNNLGSIPASPTGFESAASFHRLEGDGRAGNIYRHDYEDLAAKLIWDTVQFALPPLRKVVALFLGWRG